MWLAMHLVEKKMRIKTTYYHVQLSIFAVVYNLILLHLL